MYNLSVKARFLLSLALLAALPAASSAADFFGDLAALPAFRPAPPAVPPPLRASGAAGDVSVFSLPGFLGGRRVRVYLPPGYAARPGRRYPVLYMHDGQNLFDDSTSYAGEWRVDETCEELIRAGRIPPLIVVGVDNALAGRLDEYTPWPDPEHGGGKADAYLKALKDVLKPEIDRRYRTLKGPEDTLLAGSSLGGLVSAYAGYLYPGTWGTVIAMSPSYWWAGEKFASWMEARKKPGLKFFYQDMGTSEGSGGGEENIAGLRRVERIALASGFAAGKDFFSLEVPGHVHSEACWAARFPRALELAFGRRAGGPQ